MTLLHHTPGSFPVGGAYVVRIVPSDEDERQAAAMETWFQACATDEPFTLELVGTRREQGFFLRASSEHQLVTLVKQFEAQYPQAEVSRIAPQADHLLLHRGEHGIIGEFALARASWMPLKTFPSNVLLEPGNDPLAGILAAMEALSSDDDRIIAQLSLTRAPEHWIAPDIRKAVEHPLQSERDRIATSMRGVSLESDARRGVRLLLLLGGGFLVLQGYHWYQRGALLPLSLLLILSACLFIFFCWRFVRGETPAAIYDMKLVNEKLSRAAFYTQLRVIAISTQASSTRQALQDQILRMEVAYRQFTLASANSLYLKRVRYLQTGQARRAKRLVDPLSAFPYAHPLVRFLHKGAPGNDIWNGLELAGAYHLPQAMTDAPLVRRMSVKHLLFPPEVAMAISSRPAPLPPTRIGTSSHRGHQVPVLLPFPTLFAHKVLFGRSRSGKTVLMQLMIDGAMRPISDGSPQPGLFIIDPHHDLIEDLLRTIPAHRLHDVVLLDMTDPAFPVGLNPLDATMGFSRDQAVSHLMSCFERIWSDYWGPRMSYFLKNVCLLLFTLNEQAVSAGRAHEQFTLLDINPLLQYQEYAKTVLTQLDLSETWHQELLSWWQNTYFTLPKNSSFRQEVILPILSKMGTFHDNQQLRRIVGQPITTARVHEAVTRGKMVLCALASRDMDDASVNILGSTLINLLHRAFVSQHTVPLQARRRVFCAVDEFQAFSGADYERLLSEDGKYGCAMLLASQNLKRLNKIKDGLLDMVLSNCENLCVFNVSAEDAHILEKELQEKVTQKHIISQPRLHCYARLAIPGYPLQVASVELSAPPSWQPSAASHQRASIIRQANQRRYRRADEVDLLHAGHLTRFLQMDDYARRLVNEVRAKEATRHAREAAQEREQHVQATRSPLLTVVNQHPYPAPAVASSVPVASPMSSALSAPMEGREPTRSSQKGDEERHATALAQSTSCSPTAPEEASSEAPTKRRNHPRSRRQHRQPPTVPGEPARAATQQSEEEGTEVRVPADGRRKDQGRRGWEERERAW